MRLVDLSPRLLLAPEGRLIKPTLSLTAAAAAGGILFLCPQCVQSDSPTAGGHRVLCWTPAVGQEHEPGPGRWYLRGTSFVALTLVGGSTRSSSVLLPGEAGCQAHSYVIGGRIILF